MTGIVSQVFARRHHLQALRGLQPEARYATRSSLVSGSASVARTASSTSGLAAATARRHRRRPLFAGTRAQGLADGSGGTKAQVGIGAMREQSRTKKIEQLMAVRRQGPWRARQRSNCVFFTMWPVGSIYIPPSNEGKESASKLCLKLNLLKGKLLLPPS